MAENQVEVTERETRQQPAMHRQGKKTPLAYEMRRNRSFTAVVSVGDEARPPFPAQRESRSSRVFAAAAARHHRLCRRPAFRFGAAQIA
jgi:hypothetical protein